MNHEDIPAMSCFDLVKVISTWGVQYSPDMQAAPGFTCPNCHTFSFTGSGSLGYTQKFAESIVGYSTENPARMSSHGFEAPNPLACGCLIVECPNCFEKSWIHVDPLALSLLIEMYPHPWSLTTAPRK